MREQMDVPNLRSGIAHVIDTPNRALAIEKFRLTLAAMGVNSFLLTDDEVWAWAEELVRPLLQPRLQLKEVAKFVALHGNK